MHCRNDDTVGEPSPDKGRSSRRHFLSQLAALSASLTIAAPAAARRLFEGTFKTGDTRFGTR